MNYLEIPGHTNEQDFERLYELCEMAPQQGIMLEIGSLYCRSSVFFAETFRKLNKNYTIYCLDQFGANVSTLESLKRFDGNTEILKPLLDNTKSVIELITEYISEYQEIRLLKTNLFMHIPKEIRHKKLSFVFEDSAHTYESTSHCLETYYPYLEADGIFCGDDFNLPPVKRAVTEFADKHNLSVETKLKIWNLNVHT